MSRPRIKPETFEQDLEWFGHHGQSPWFARIGHRVVAARQQPRVMAAPGTPAVLNSLLASNTRLVLAANHPTGARDTEVLAAVPAVYQPLNSLQGETRIMAAAKLWNGRGPKSKLRAGVMTRLGAYPVINTDLFPDISEQRREELRIAHADFTARQLSDGWHIASFVEGDKDRSGNPEVVRPVRSGIKHIFDALPRGVLAAVVPIGMSYPTAGGPSVCVGEPIMAPATTPDLLGDMRDRIQHCVDVARGVAAA